MNINERKTININNNDYNLYLPYSNLTGKNKGTDYNDLKTTIIYFISVMGANCKYFNLDKFLEKIQHTEFNKIDDNGYGEFFPDTNKIIYSDTTSLIHELLHLSSSFETDLCGFMAYDEDEEQCGMGLNEGYTEYILSKYFYENKDSPYGLETICAQLIEKIIGEDTMEKLYFEGNLKGLIQVLSKYTTEKEIKCFIEALDILEILNISDLEDLKTKNNYIACKVSIEFIFDYLKHAYVNKLSIDEVENNDIIDFINPNLWRKGCEVTHYENGVQKHKRLVLASSVKYQKLLNEIEKIKGINQ